MSRKYPKTTDYYNYAHILPNKLVYFGYSKQETCDRWQPKWYKSTVLYPYIQQYGWENIKHIVIQDGLTKEQAKAIEGVLIKQGKIDGLCINRQNSGNKGRKEHLYDYNHSEKGYECRKRYAQSEKGIETRKKYTSSQEFKKRQQEYNKQYRLENLEKYIQYNKEYQEEHKEELKQKNKQYYQKNKEKWLTPEKKVYRRVANYNRYHTPIETPLEAKNKYLEYGYIPSYIKNDDLK